MTEQKTYELKFVCVNCGHEFSQKLPFGKDAEESWGFRVFCGYDIIQCPNCGSFQLRKK